MRKGTCSCCATEFPLAQLRLMDGKTYCEACGAKTAESGPHEQLYNFPFPQWLKAGLAFSPLLLVVVLAHGARYFRIGHGLYRGERLLKTKQYAEAAEFLAPVAAAAPECQKCVLLLAKAYLLTGRPDLAWEASKEHHDGHFANDHLVDEVRPLF